MQVSVSRRLLRCWLPVLGIHLEQNLSSSDSFPRLSGLHNFRHLFRELIENGIGDCPPLLYRLLNHEKITAFSHPRPLIFRCQLQGYIVAEEGSSEESSKDVRRPGGPCSMFFPIFENYHF